MDPVKARLTQAHGHQVRSEGAEARAASRQSVPNPARLGLLAPGVLRVRIQILMFRSAVERRPRFIQTRRKQGKGQAIVARTVGDLCLLNLYACSFGLILHSVDALLDELASLSPWSAPDGGSP